LTTENCGEGETANGVSTLRAISYIRKRYRETRTNQVLAMRVHFTTKIIRIQVDKLLVDEPVEDGIVRSFPVLDTVKGASRDKPGPVSGFGTPGHHLAFLVTDCRIWHRGRPEAEI